MPGIQWRSKDVWIRRTFDADKTDLANLILQVKYGDNVQIYLNGQEISNGETPKQIPVYPLRKATKQIMR